jgi:hypothetical protein
MEIADYSHLSGQSEKVIVGGQTRESMPLPRQITIVRRCKNSEAAKSWGKRFGTVLRCFKVGIAPYLYNIESLNLDQKKIEVEVREEEFTLNSDMELTRTRREKINIEIVDKP